MPASAASRRARTQPRAARRRGDPRSCGRRLGPAGVRTGERARRRVRDRRVSRDRLAAPLEDGARAVPLRADMFRVRPRGHHAIRNRPRRLADGEKDRALQSLGEGRSRSGSVGHSARTLPSPGSLAIRRLRLLRDLRPVDAPARGPPDPLAALRLPQRESVCSLTSQTLVALRAKRSLPRKRTHRGMSLRSRREESPEVIEGGASRRGSERE